MDLPLDIRIEIHAQLSLNTSLNILFIMFLHFEVHAINCLKKWKIVICKPTKIKAQWNKSNMTLTDKL